MSPAVVFGGQRLTADKTPVRTLSSKGTADGTGHAEVQGSKAENQTLGVLPFGLWTVGYWTNAGTGLEPWDETRIGRDTSGTGHERRHQSLGPRVRQSITQKSFEGGETNGCQCVSRVWRGDGRGIHPRPLVCPGPATDLAARGAGTVEVLRNVQRQHRAAEGGRPKRDRQTLHPLRLSQALRAAQDPLRLSVNSNV